MTRKHRAQYLLGGVDDYIALIRVALHQCRCERLGLSKCDMRWQRGHVRIGFDLQYDRAIPGECFVPRSTHLVRVVHIDPFQPDQFGKLVICDGGMS